MRAFSHNVSGARRLSARKLSARVGGSASLPSINPKPSTLNQLAFTIIELLVVIAIIGLLTAIGLPAIRGMTKSTGMISANRQLQDDLAYARQRALSDHTTVYVVFLPPDLATYAGTYTPTNMDPVTLRQFTNAWGGQYTTYALLSLRSVGDQPGRPTPHYLTSWRSLPNGVFFATNNFYIPPPPTGFYVTNIFPFPFATNAANATLPYLAFDYLGRLTQANGQLAGYDAYIPLARGSVFYARDANGGLMNSVADAEENPPFNSSQISNVIHIDWLTGHARIERQEVK